MTFSSKFLKLAAQLLQPAEPLDRLAYTPGFDSLVSEFNRLAGKVFTPHQVWEYCLSARKRGLVGSRTRNQRGHQ